MTLKVPIDQAPVASPALFGLGLACRALWSEERNFPPEENQSALDGQESAAHLE
jgi:hypothetical protein